MMKMHAEKRRPREGELRGAESSCVPGEEYFCYWLFFAATIFGAIGSKLIRYYETLLKANEQIEFTKFLLTMIFFYGYMRMLMHVVTLHLLKRHSATINLFSSPSQNDSAFMVIDFVSIFLWVPLATYSFSKVFTTANPDIFYDQMQPGIYAVAVVYHIDRLLQLTVHFRLDRLLHHFFECVLMLAILEWGHSGGLIWSIPIIMVECYSRLTWCFHVSARFTRKFVQTQNGNWDPSAINFVDSFFIAKTAERQRRFMQLGYVMHVCILFILPFSI